MSRTGEVEGAAGPRGTLRTAFANAERHPVVTTALVALLVRVTLVGLVEVFKSTPIVPDEWQYVTIADKVAHGGTAASFFNGYGQELYKGTLAYSGTLARLLSVFGGGFLTGRLLSAAAGVGVAAIAAAITGRVAGRRWALAAGILVAVLPSQVLWSSAAIRESTVWLSIGAVGLSLALLARARGRGAVGALALAAAGVVALGLLRDQTQVVVVWSFLLGVVLLPSPPRMRLALAGAGLGLVLVVPALTGAGAGGITLVRNAFPKLGTYRIYGAMEANSAFVPTTVVGQTRTGTNEVIPGTSPAPSQGSSPGAAPSSPGATPTTTPGQSGIDQVIGYGGQVYDVDSTASASIDHVPSGLVATQLRPWPWERTNSSTMAWAGLESPAWWLLYLFAAVGLVVSWSRLRGLGVFLGLSIGGMALGAALTEGNLGSAFRHRGQVLLPLVVLAAMGAEATYRRWERRTA